MNRAPIDWTRHLAAREAAATRSRLRRTLASREEEETHERFTPWWVRANKHAIRNLGNGGFQMINLIGDFLPDDI